MYLIGVFGNIYKQEFPKIVLAYISKYMSDYFRNFTPSGFSEVFTIKKVQETFSTIYE